MQPSTSFSSTTFQGLRTASSGFAKRISRGRAACSGGPGSGELLPHARRLCSKALVLHDELVSEHFRCCSFMLQCILKTVEAPILAFLRSFAKPVRFFERTGVQSCILMGVLQALDAQAHSWNKTLHSHAARCSCVTSWQLGSSCVLVGLRW